MKFRIFLYIYSTFLICNVSFSAAIVSEDDMSVSEESLLSEFAEFDSTDMIAYRSHSFKHLEFIISKNGVFQENKNTIRGKLDFFYLIARLYFAYPSRDLFNYISNFQQEIYNDLFSNGRGYFCNRVDLIYARDSIVEDLETILDIIETTLLPSGN